MIESTRFLTSSSTSETSSPSITSMVTAPPFSAAIEVTFSMPEMPCTSSSMRWQIDSSTSAGAAPG